MPPNGTTGKSSGKTGARGPTGPKGEARSSPAGNRGGAPGAVSRTASSPRGPTGPRGESRTSSASNSGRGVGGGGNGGPGGGMMGGRGFGGPSRTAPSTGVGSRNSYRSGFGSADLGRVSGLGSGKTTPVGPNRSAPSKGTVGKVGSYRSDLSKSFGRNWADNTFTGRAFSGAMRALGVKGFAAGGLAKKAKKSPPKKKR